MAKNKYAAVVEEKRPPQSLLDYIRQARTKAELADLERKAKTYEMASPQTRRRWDRAITHMREMLDKETT